MPDRQRRSKQRNQEKNDTNEKSNDILAYGRGEQPRVTDAEMAIWRQKQMLMCEGELKPSCTDFGPDCNILYPDFYFFWFCINWDNRPIENKQLKQNQNKYKCRAGHISFLHPTTKKKN